MKIILLLSFIFIAGCGKLGKSFVRGANTSVPVNISSVTTENASLRKGKWTVVEVNGVSKTATVSGTSSDGLNFSGNKTRLNVRSIASEGLLNGSLRAALGSSQDDEAFQLTIMPGYPEIQITQFALNSGNIYDIAGSITHHTTLPVPTDYKIIACLHVDIYYCQNLATVNADGTFAKVGHNFFGGFPSADRVQFILAHNTATLIDQNGVFDNFLETNTRHSVWKAMDGTTYINFKNYHLLNNVSHTDLQVQHLMSRLGKYEQTAGVGIPAFPARFVRSFLDIDQFYLYDQALAVIAFSRANESVYAKTVLNALKNQWTSHGSAGWWYFSYNSDNSGSPYPVEGDRRMAGAIAWTAMAINYYKLQYPLDTDYDVMAKSVMEYLRAQTAAITVNAVTAKALRFSPVNYAPTTWDETDTVALEHNLDFHSALESFVDAFPADADVAVYNTLKSEIRLFIDSLWITSEKRFYPGAVFSTGLPNTSEIYLDTQSWGVLTLGSSYKSGLEKNCDLFMETAGFIQGGNAGLAGFYDYKPASGASPFKFVWSEGTAGQILALDSVFADTGENLTCQGITRTNLLSNIQNMAFANGGVPYTTVTGNDSFTISSSVAGTAWLYFANQGFNPFRP